MDWNEAAESLQERLANIDFMRAQGPLVDDLGRERIIKVQIAKKGPLKLKMYQEVGHKPPHIHVDYGRRPHVASYRLDTGERIDGNLSRDYDRTISRWISMCEKQLVILWGEMQAGNKTEVLIADLPEFDG